MDVPGGMDLRDEVAGTGGTIWLNHFLRTGFEMFTAGGGGGYVAEKAETADGWLFPVGDEVVGAGLRGHVHRHVRCDRGGTRRETFYDGYVSTRSWTPLPFGENHAWEPVELFEWRGGARRVSPPRPRPTRARWSSSARLLPDGRIKLIVKDPATGDFTDREVTRT